MEWTLLLRLPLVPLAFTMLGGGYGLPVRARAPPDPVCHGILTGATVLLSPAMLLRDQRKQYTAEAFACLVRRDFRRLLKIAGASGGMLIVGLVIYVTVIRAALTWLRRYALAAMFPIMLTLASDPEPQRDRPRPAGAGRRTR